MEGATEFRYGGEGERLWAITATEAGLGVRRGKPSRRGKEEVSLAGTQGRLRKVRGQVVEGF